MKLIYMPNTFKNRYQLTKNYQVKKRYQMNKSTLGGYQMKDTSRNEISIGTLKKNDVKLPKERMVPNKPSALQSFMMAQSTKRNDLHSTNTHLKRITR